MYKKLLSISLLFLTLTSCMQVAQQVNNWAEPIEGSEIYGDYFQLDDDAIKVFLPDSFVKYSAVEYQQMLDSMLTKEAYEFETRRLRYLREMEGNHYLFFDKGNGATYSINTMPFTPIYKRDAQQLLGLIRLNYEQTTAGSDLEFNKITAKYSSNAGTQIFKAVYRVDNKETQITAYSASYILSGNKKTVMINLTTPFEVDFDPYLQKMIL
ncbi:hypothetical protein [Mangrovimonas xylaniphaga]|uniref:hypothetical protein n=1 Tax=Mangrovimonas xylaniphaga TaxID=1645915 RepID=UPI0012FB1712|nr:hypothetical protein [Mangrovimonas xylaniphaga]